MKGLEISEKFFYEYGLPMIEKEFSEYKDRIAAGLVGHGSECFGFDDEISTDHDFEPGFSLWITAEDERKFGFKLFRAYSRLPKEYLGLKVADKSLFGSDTKGVHTIEGFYSFYTGSGDAPESYEQWLSIPDFYLAEATNGKVFYDPSGKFSEIRDRIKYGCPEDVRLKKLSSAVFNAAQAGQYNYFRCLSHGEKGAAALSLNKFAENALHAVFLLNKSYMPYYKWAFRQGKLLPKLTETVTDIEKTVVNPSDEKSNKYFIEKIAFALAEEIRKQGLSERTDDYLEPYAYCIKNNIKDGNLRNTPVMM